MGNYCRQCGHDNQVGSHFCVKCGAAYPEMIAPQSKSPKTSSRKTRGLQRFISPAIHLTISTIIGMLIGQVASFIYAIISGTGLSECLSLPLSILVFALSMFANMKVSRWIRKLPIAFLH